jgi:vacuolar-type H+-ATPase subunit H
MSDTLVSNGQEVQDALPRTDTDVEAELADLHEFVRAGTSFFNHAVWIDLVELETRLERIQAAMPRELKRARRISREEKQILQSAKEEAARVIGEARAEAEELVACARREAERMVDQSAIKQAAAQQAEEILRHAQANAQEVRDRSFAYGRDVLAALNTTVDNMRQQIQLGQEQLKPPG